MSSDPPPSGTIVDRLREVGDEWPPVLAAVWRRAGWSVERAGDDDRALLATREGADGHERRILLAVAGHRRTTGDDVREAVEHRNARDVDGVTVATPVGFTAAALDAADAYGVDTVGPEAIARRVIALGAEDLLGDGPLDGGPRDDGGGDDSVGDKGDGAESAGEEGAGDGAFR